MTFFIGTAWLIGAALLLWELRIASLQVNAERRIARGMSQAGRSALARSKGDGDV